MGCLWTNPPCQKRILSIGLAGVSVNSVYKPPSEISDASGIITDNQIHIDIGDINSHSAIPGDMELPLQ